MVNQAARRDERAMGKNGSEPMKKPEAGQHTCAQAPLVALFRSAAAKPIYDKNPALWDAVLRDLNLALCYQPAVAKVLKEGRWENARGHNHKAYIATAASSLAHRWRLPDYADGDFKQDDGDELITYQDAIDLQHYCAIRDCYIDEDEPSGRIEDYIPRHLQTSEHSSIVIDWSAVALRAVRKEPMLDAVADVLRFRARGASRDETLLSIADEGQRKTLQAAWKWVDRNWESRIVPVLRGGALPDSVCANTKPESGFTPPWLVLERLNSRDRSLKNQNCGR